MKTTRTLLLILLTGGLLSMSHGESIGLNLGVARTDTSLDPADIAGVVPQANWNNLSGATGGPINPVDSEGDATIAEVTWATDEEWSVAGTATTPDGKLLNGFFSENNNDGSSVSITGIPYALYDLYIYVSHDRASEDVILTEANGAFPEFTAIENDTDVNAAVVFEEQTDSGTGSGNYVLFSALDQSDLTIEMTAVNIGGSIDRNAISAIQIVEVDLGDNDGDGLDNTWETANGLDPNDNGLNPNNNGVPGNPDNGADGDPDGDGSPNSREQAQGSDPQNEDSDGDTLLDGVETGTGVWVSDMDRGTSPTKKDSDGDALGDEVETNTGTVDDPLTATGTNPNEPDTDNDTLRDDWEVMFSLSPFDDGTTDSANGAAGDPDSDDSTNGEEQTRGTDPQDDDSDDDNLLDGVETNDGNYVDASATGTDPLDPDSDGDTLQDDVEDASGVFTDASATGTDPNLPDTDGDFLRDDWELANGYSPVDGNNNVLDAGGIGINLGAGRADAALNAADFAGVFAQANWNNLSAATGGSVALNDDLGTASGASASWNLDEEWSVAGPAADPNGVLLTGWFSANNNGAPNTIDITDIPYVAYDLVVYFNHDRGTEDTDISESNGAFPLFVLHENDPNVLEPIVFSQQVESFADVPEASGNFAIFTNLSGANLNLVVSGGVDNTVRNPLNGIQIINRGGSGDIVITEVAPNLGGNSATITWNSVPGRKYVVDRSVDLTEGSWLEIGDELVATEDTMSFTDLGINFQDNPRRFYRVRLAPTP